MARGDKVVGLESVGHAAYMTIQPGSGVEWSIHNIYGAAACELYVYNGAIEIKIDVTTEPKSWLSYFFDLTNAHYLRLKNVSGAAAIFGYDGVITK